MYSASSGKGSYLTTFLFNAHTKEKLNKDERQEEINEE